MHPNFERQAPLTCLFLYSGDLPENVSGNRYPLEIVTVVANEGNYL